MHKIKKQRQQMRVHPVVTGSATQDSRVAVEALAEELRQNGMDDLASNVVLGPIGLAAETVSDEDEIDAESDDAADLDDDMEDILEDASTDDEDEDEFSDEEDDDTFDEALDDNDISDEDDEADADEEDDDQVNPIQEVILDPDRVYSAEERNTLRSIANLCIARKHHVPNARALIRSLDAYESKRSRRA